MDSDKFTVSHLEKIREEEKNEETIKKEKASVLKKKSRAEEAKEAALRKKMVADAQKAEAEASLAEMQTIRTKIDAYFKSDFWGKQLEKTVMKPRPSDKLPELKEKLQEIHRFKEKATATNRLVLTLDGLCELGDTKWQKLPEPFRFNLTDIGPGKKYNAIIHQNFAPLIEEALIEYPMLSYAPFPVRVLQTVWGCLKMVDACNNNPALLDAARLGNQPAQDINPLPKRDISK